MDPVVSLPRRGATQTRDSCLIITHSFAVEKGSYGYIWKIYIEAKDPDGDMLRIASVVDQVGYGHYPTDWIYLKAGHEKQFKGYIQWNTFSSKTPYLSEWTRIELKISVLDKAGNESNVVVFPFEFVSGVIDQYQYKLPAPFDQRELPRLGYIHIDLYDPTTNTGDEPVQELKCLSDLMLQIVEQIRPTKCLFVPLAFLPVEW
jgi:hypothetical protein